MLIMVHNLHLYCAFHSRDLKLFYNNELPSVSRTGCVCACAGVGRAVYRYLFNSYQAITSRISQNYALIGCGKASGGFSTVEQRSLS